MALAVSPNQVAGSLQSITVRLCSKKADMERFPMATDKACVCRYLVEAYQNEFLMKSKDITRRGLQSQEGLHRISFQATI